MKSNLRFLVIWALIIGGILVILSQTGQPKPKSSRTVTFSEFMKLVHGGKIASVQFQGESKITGKFAPTHEKGAEFETVGDTRSDVMVHELVKNGVVPDYVAEPKTSFLQSLLGPR